MIILIAGYGHTGKTLLAQKLLEKLSYPYLSIDHLKMGLIRAKRTPLSPESSGAELTAYLWPIVREMIKTAIENDQNLIVEGCYIPFDFAASFATEYRSKMYYVCLLFSESYIDAHYADIFKHERVIEHRICDGQLSAAELKTAHKRNLEQCQKYGLDYILIDEKYDIDCYVQMVLQRSAAT